MQYQINVELNSVLSFVLFTFLKFSFTANINDLNVSFSHFRTNYVMILLKLEHSKLVWLFFNLNFEYFYKSRHIKFLETVPEWVALFLPKILLVYYYKILMGVYRVLSVDEKSSSSRVTFPNLIPSAVACTYSLR